MAEYFQVFNLDLQARFHYAPNDSRSHIAEQVMRSLNEATGDGRSIPIPNVPIFEGMNEEQICSLTQDEFNALEAKRQEDIAKQCAKNVMRRYEGKKCLGTTIHSRCPSYKESDNFFFDDTYMKKVHDCSPGMQSSCAGSANYFQQLTFVEKHYKVFDGGIEAIRNGCKEGEEMCNVHQNILGCQWRGPPIRRVPAPVPLYEKESPNFHYENPNLWRDSEGTTARTVDEFCPRARIEDVIRKVGPIDVKEKEHMDEWSVNKSVNDKNDTLNKMLAHVDDIIEKYTGEDLRQVVEAEFKRIYTMLVKAYLAKKARAVAKENKLSKTVDEIDWCNKIQSGTLDKMYVSQLDMYLEKVAGLKKSIIQEKGFSKAKKVEAVKRHYYSCNNHILTTSTQKLRQPQTLCQPLQPLAGEARQSFLEPAFP